MMKRFDQNVDDKKTDRSKFIEILSNIYIAHVSSVSHHLFTLVRVVKIVQTSYVAKFSESCIISLG